MINVEGLSSWNNHSALITAGDLINKCRILNLEYFFPLWHFCFYVSGESEYFFHHCCSHQDSQGPPSGRDTTDLKSQEARWHSLTVRAKTHTKSD